MGQVHSLPSDQASGAKFARKFCQTPVPNCPAFGLGRLGPVLGLLTAKVNPKPAPKPGSGDGCARRVPDNSAPTRRQAVKVSLEEKLQMSYQQLDQVISTAPMRFTRCSLLAGQH